jgi:hypothetical protein
MSKSAGFANALAQGINGYLRGMQYNADIEKSKNDTAFQNEQRDRLRREQSESDSLKTGLRDAARPVDMTQGASGMVRPDTMDNRDVGLPENTPLPNKGLMQGEFRVRDKAFASQAEAQTAANAMNTPDAVNSRMADVYRQVGQPDKALSMENAVMTSKLNKIGLTQKEAEFADFKTNQLLKTALESGPDWTTGAAGVLAKTQIGGLAGVDVKPRVSADGKTVDFVGNNADGEKVLASFPNSDVGQAAFIKRFMAAPLESKISWVAEQAKADATERKLVADETRAGAAERNADTNARKADGMLMRLATGGGSGGGGGGSGGVQPLGAQVGLKDRRDMLNDYGSMLPDARAALDPEQGQKIMADNARRMEQADAIFSMNASAGQVLTAPQILAAQQASLAEPKSVKLLRDSETGAIYQTVMVSGKAVIVGQSRVKQAETGAPAPAVANANVDKPPPPPLAPAPNTPPEIAVRMQRVLAAEQARKTDQVARTTADRDKQKALKAESAWLTTDAARTLRPSEAQQYLQAYGSVLDPAVQRELRKRM